MSDPLKELLRRKEAEAQRDRWLDAFFEHQRGYVRSRGKLLTALCSRRAGKSIGNAGRLVRAADRHPGEMSLYVSLTKNNSRMIVGRALMDLSRRYELNLRIKEVDQRLMCIHPNGHYMWLAGAKNRVDFEQFRGYKFGEVIVDEAQLYGSWLKEVMEDVLEPCIGDLDGAIALTGTPSPLPVGFFHSVTTGDDVDEFGEPIPQWETHHWTVADNVHFRSGRGAEWRDEVRRRRGWSPEHPTLLREYYGLWVKDLGALVYPLDLKPVLTESGDTAPGRNAFWDLPYSHEPYSYVIGVDIGYTDDTAFVVLGFRRGHPEIYVVEAGTHTNMIPSKVAAELMRLRQKYGPLRIVIDAQAKGYIEEFKARYGIACEGSEKLNKMAYVDMLRGDIMSGVVKLHPHKARDLVDEMAILQWNEDRDGIDERFPDHVCDAMLYGWRATRTYYRPELNGPPPGSPEWVNKPVADHKESLIKVVDQQLWQKWKKFSERARRFAKRGY